MAAPRRFHQGHASERRSTFLSYPYFYSDSDYASGEVSQPQIVVVPGFGAGCAARAAGSA